MAFTGARLRIGLRDRTLAGPPNQDEAIYVLEGEPLVDIEGEQHRVGQDGFIFAPRGVAHADAAQLA